MMVYFVRGLWETFRRTRNRYSFARKKGRITTVSTLDLTSTWKKSARFVWRPLKMNRIIFSLELTKAIFTKFIQITPSTNLSDNFSSENPDNIAEVFRKHNAPITGLDLHPGDIHKNANVSQIYNNFSWTTFSYQALWIGL